MRLAYVVPELPTVTQTFVVDEIDALGRAGDLVLPVALAAQASGRSPEAGTLHPSRIPAAILWRCAEAMVRHPRTTLHQLVSARREGVLGILRQVLAIGMAMGAMASVKAFAPAVIHAHFADRPLDVALFIGSVLGIPVSVSVHATDIYRHGPHRPRVIEQLCRCVGVRAISEHGARTVTDELGQSPHRVTVVRLGISESWIQPEPAEAESSVTEGRPLRIVTIARVIEKKGWKAALSAISTLEGAGIDYRWTWVGGGPDLERAREEARGTKFSFVGPMPPTHVRRLVTSADLFVLPCRPAESGDEDGIPVSLMEAMAVGTPVVAGDVGGISELVTSETGTLLSRRSTGQEVAETVSAWMQKGPYEKARVRRRAQCIIIEHYSLSRNIHLLQRFLAMGTES